MNTLVQMVTIGVSKVVRRQEGDGARWGATAEGNPFITL